MPHDIPRQMKYKQNGNGIYTVTLCIYGILLVIERFYIQEITWQQTKTPSTEY